MLSWFPVCKKWLMQIYLQVTSKFRLFIFYNNHKTQGNPTQCLLRHFQPMEIARQTWAMHWDLQPNILGLSCTGYKLYTHTHLPSVSWYLRCHSRAHDVLGVRESDTSIWQKLEKLDGGKLDLRGGNPRFPTLCMKHYFHPATHKYLSTGICHLLTHSFIPCYMQNGMLAADRLVTFD